MDRFFLNRVEKSTERFLVEYPTDLIRRHRQCVFLCSHYILDGPVYGESWATVFPNVARTSAMNFIGLRDRWKGALKFVNLKLNLGISVLIEDLVRFLYAGRTQRSF